MELIGWLIFGALVGWLASKIMGTDPQQGALMNIIIGIVGALLGGWIANVIGLGTPGFGWLDPIGWIIAIIGAVILIFLWQLITGRRRV
jgi:uncharacterized membrane protein YeaQ/YmgE (transglycosylase-associated protein family)